MLEFDKIYLCIFFLLLPSISFSQIRIEVINGDSISIFTHPTKKLIEEKTSIEIIKVDTLFYYEYAIESSLSSKQDIWLWLLITDSEIQSVQSPLNWSFLDSGIPRRISWAAKKSQYRIKPEEEVNGFSFTSKELPTIKKYYMEGWARIFLRAGEEPDSVENSSFFDTAKKGYTVFPREGSLTTTIIEIVDTLETFRFRSCEELDWTTDAGVCSQLETQLSEVKSSLITEDSLSAANTLKEFIDLVEAEKEGSLTSEGYALLYFNAQYLAALLPEPDPGSGITCGCDNPITQTSGQIVFSDEETKCLSGTFSGAVFFQNGGTLQVCGMADFQNISGNQPGKVEVSETGNVTVGNWNNNNSDDAFTNWGVTTFTNWTTVNNGTLTNHGVMHVNGGLNQNNGPIINSGALTVNNSVNLNESGNKNEGEWTVNGDFTLNSNAVFDNSCHVETGGKFMVNGDYVMRPGSFTNTSGQLTINSNGSLAMEGENTQFSANQGMFNGTINTAGGVNLVTSQSNFNFNNSASINTEGEALYMVASNLSALLGSFNVTDGSQLVIPVTSCNPNGYNSNQ